MARLRTASGGADRILAAVLFVLAELAVGLAGQTPVVLAVVLGAAMTIPFAWRRSHPLPATAILIGSVLGQSVGVDGSQPLVPICIAIAAYTTGHELHGRAALAGLGLIVVPLWIGLALVGAEFGEFVSVAVIFGAVWMFGRGLRDRGRRVTALAAHAEQLEREGSEREAAAAEAERARIARELHDIVAHSISVIAVQTQAVRRRLGPGTEREQRDLEDVETTARDALAEMRRLFGVLRAQGSSASLSPQPGLAQLPRLLEQTEAGGVPVDVSTEGEPRPLTAGVDLAAYRVVQEALTNVRRHAPGAGASVRLDFGLEALQVEVENDGGVVRMNGSGGHGLIGMRERVHLYGGTFNAGPRPEGGFRVTARLPTGDQRA